MKLPTTFPDTFETLALKFKRFQNVKICFTDKGEEYLKHVKEGDVTRLWSLDYDHAMNLYRLGIYFPHSDFYVASDLNPNDYMEIVHDTSVTYYTIVDKDTDIGNITVLKYEQDDYSLRVDQRSIVASGTADEVINALCNLVW